MENGEKEKNNEERIFKLQRITIILLFGVFAAICVLIWQNSSRNENLEVIEAPIAIQTGSSTTEQNFKVADEDATEVNKDDEFASWKNYTNNDVGYKLKYPADWVLKDVNELSEITDKDVKYITVTTPDKKYFIHFGLAKKGASYSTTDRSGIGAGDIVKNGEITILKTTFKSDELVYKDKIKELFYPQGVKITADDKWQFTASFSASDKVDYATLDMTNLEERLTAEKILSTVEIL